MKKGLEAFDYLQVGGLRIFISFIILLPISISNLKYLTKDNFFYIILCGFLGQFFPAFLFTLSETEISSSLAGTLNGLTPFFTLIIGILFFGKKNNFIQSIGIIIGLMGATLIVTNLEFSSLFGINIFVFPIIVATIFYGLNSNIVSSKLNRLNGLQISSLSFFFIGPVAGIVLFFSDYHLALQSGDLLFSFISVLILSLFGSVLTLMIFYNLIKKTDPVFASSSTYFIPFFALM